MAKSFPIFTLGFSGPPNEAYYTVPPIPEFQKSQNKSVLALRYLEQSDIKFMIRQIPDISPVLGLSPNSRIEQLKIDVSTHFEPFLDHLNLGMNLFSTMRMGYINRNLEDPFYVNKIENVLKSLSELWDQDFKDPDSMELRLQQNRFSGTTPPYVSTNYQENFDVKFGAYGGVFDSFSFSVSGQPGMGKSRTIRKLCALQPPFIYHPHLEGPIQSAYQIPYVILDVPHNGALRSLCENFITCVCQITRTNFFQHFQIDDRTNTVQMMGAMASLCAAYSIGVIVLDEIQYLLHVSGQKQAWVINFLNDISNKLGIPLVLVGTYETKKILDMFHLSRRFLGQPEPMWNPLSFCSLEKKNPVEDSWRRFIKGMWNYQYVLNPTPLTEDWNELFYDKSCGIIDMAQKLFVFTQIRAIQSGLEKINPTILENIYSDYFTDLDRYLNLIRNKQWDELKDMPEYSAISIDEFLAAENMRTLYDLGQVEKTTPNPQLESDMDRVSDETQKREEKNLGQEEPNVTDLPDTIIELDEGFDNDIGTTFDLRQFEVKGDKSGSATAEALREAGIIIDPLDLLGQMDADVPSQ